MLFLLLKWKLNYWAVLHVQDKNSEKMQSGRGFWFEILINNFPNLNVVYGLYVDVSTYYWFCNSRNFKSTLATRILLPVLRISTCCITLSYFGLPPKLVIVINSASVGRVQMWKVEYIYGKTNRTHAHTTKFTIFIGFVSHISSIIWT